MLCACSHTDSFTNFDGVTYGKGASVLKQLVAVIGMDSFKKGMQLYFQKCVVDVCLWVDVLGRRL